jgi:hypothetical protein
MKGKEKEKGKEDYIHSMKSMKGLRSEKKAIDEEQRRQLIKLALQKK